MKFTIEIENFYLDSEDDIEPALKNHVQREVIKSIYKTIEDRVEKQVTMEVKEHIEKVLYSKISSIVKLVVESEEIKNPVTGKAISLVDWIKKEFQSNTGYRSPEEQIKILAKKFGDEMKARYDMQFAAHVVNKMHEVGLLKDDVLAKLTAG